MLRLLMDGAEYQAKEYAKTFRDALTAKCAFIARDEKQLEDQAAKFAGAIQRVTGAYLLTIDMAQKANEGKSPLTAVYEEFCLLASRTGVPIPDTKSRITAIEKLSKLLCVPAIEERSPTPIIRFKHFQCCKLVIREKELSEYSFLREIPCRLVISANMEIIEIEYSISPIGGSSILAPLVKQITIENDVPFKCSEISKACAAV